MFYKTILPLMTLGIDLMVPPTPPCAKLPKSSKTGSRGLYENCFNFMHKSHIIVVANETT
jgi:hypothetical protein